MAQLNYDPNAPQTDFDGDALPPGWYAVVVESEEVKQTKKAIDRVPGCENDQYLQLELTVTGPTHAGRKVWWRFNLWNSNPTAAEIANREIASLLGTLNMPPNCDSSQLVGAPFEVKLAVRNDNNDVKACRAVGAQPAAYGALPGAPLAGPAAPAAPPVAPPAPAQTTAPWAR